MNIPLWSQTNLKAKEILLPTEPVAWGVLTTDEKQRLWKHLEYFLFNPTIQYDDLNFSNVKCSYRFYGEDMWENDRFAKTVAYAVGLLNTKYKKHSYARNYLENGTFDNACHDFYELFLNASRDVVFELLTLFSNAMVAVDEDGISYWKGDNETPEAFKARKEAGSWKRFDAFSKELSIVLEDFGVNYKLTRLGFVPADEPAVVEQVYKPTLKKLAHKKWAPVNRDMRDAFQALRDDKDGSGALTHALSAVQGFLQILVYGQIGKGDTAALLKEAIKQKKMPDDDFTRVITKDVAAFWAKERQSKGDPHPKQTYATKAQAKLVISLVMVLIDYTL